MYLIISAVFGLICALIASSKGRSAIGWFLIGFLLGFIGLIIICVVSDLKKQQAKEERLRAETRRLREQVRKDRMIADRRHRNIEQRLGAHDRVVGIDTSQGAPDRQIGHAGYDDYPGTDDYADDEQAAEDAFYADAAPPPPRPRSRQHPRSPRQR